MDRRTPDQLDKVLALADSTHEAEAIVAVRKARQMLSRDGLSFGDLARAASTHKPKTSGRSFSLFSGSSMNLEVQIALLRQKLDDVQADMQAQGVELELWRRRAGELEQAFQSSQSQAERWRQLARDTVEKLWNLGLEMPGDGVSAEDEAEQKTA
ncbi:MAG: hypothetical protein SFW62_08685 [Alphaproteobacteria bacterium]|nr:hypothetical protein [Alphaproteobacteria bacterium]